MIDFIGLFVIIEKDTNEIAYTYEEMRGEEYPRNVINDISTLVLIMNSINKDDSIKYVDMSGIIINGEMNYWEVAE